MPTADAAPPRAAPPPEASSICHRQGTGLRTVKILFVGDCGRPLGQGCREKARAEPARDLRSTSCGQTPKKAAAGGFGLTSDLRRGETLRLWCRSRPPAISLGSRPNHPLCDHPRPCLPAAGELPRARPGAAGRGHSVGGQRCARYQSDGPTFQGALPTRSPARRLSSRNMSARARVVSRASWFDFHAEASSEKWPLGHLPMADVSVCWAACHVPTARRADPPGGCLPTDAGMCGDYDSVIGDAEGSGGEGRFVTKRDAGEQPHRPRGGGNGRILLATTISTGECGRCEAGSGIGGR